MSDDTLMATPDGATFDADELREAATDARQHSPDQPSILIAQALILAIITTEALAKVKDDLAESGETIEALRERIEIQQGEISNLRRQQKR